jgi:hypothetical protein
MTAPNWTALVVKHVKRTPQRFSCLRAIVTVIETKESIPVDENAGLPTCNRQSRRNRLRHSSQFLRNLNFTVSSICQHSVSPRDSYVDLYL